MAQWVGFAHPFQETTQGFPAPASDNALIKQSIIQIVMTTPGERVMRPDFGTNAQRFVFENDGTPATAAAIRHEIHAKISKFEPRVNVEGIDVVFDQDAAGASAIITIYYVILATGQRDLVEIPISQAAVQAAGGLLG